MAIRSHKGQILTELCYSLMFFSILISVIFALIQTGEKELTKNHFYNRKGKNIGQIHQTEPRF